MYARITDGSTADYRALARFHYRNGLPATVSRVLVARRHTAHPIGVLVVSNPALNGPWRTLAWPDRFNPRDPARLNAEVRVISRVIVEPRFRGLGIGRSLLQAYLQRPLTPCTEAVAAMGAFCGVFTGAGMRAIAYPPARRVFVLRARLRKLGINSWQLADPTQTRARLTHRQHDVLERALRIFARAHRDTRALADADICTLITTAARRIAAHPVAFVTEHDGP